MNLTAAGIVAAILGVILYGIHYFMTKAKADGVIAQVEIQPKAEEIKDTAEIAQLTQEVQDAKIDYKADAERARLEYLKSRGGQ